jgi:polysaccharide biosynthesis protein PslH
LAAALLLTPVVPRSAGSGRSLRAWNWLNELASRYRVHVVVTANADDEEPPPPNCPAASLWYIGGANQVSSRTCRFTGCLLPPFVLFNHRMVFDWFCFDSSHRILSRLHKTLEHESVEKIIVFRLYLHDLGMLLHRWFPQANLELDMDDLESSTRFSVAGALLRQRNFREAILSMISAAQYHALERRLSRRYHAIWLAASEDADKCRFRLGNRVQEFRNRLPKQQPAPQMASNSILNLLFVGTLDYPPNVEAIYYLIRKVLPGLRQRLHVPWRMVIVGRHASGALRAAMERFPEVNYLATVTDLQPIYAQAHMVLVPLWSGGGTKLKTLEGFAHCRPLISTPEGVRGLGAIAGKHYWLAESSDAFITGIVHLADNPVLAEKLAAIGFDLFMAQFVQSSAPDVATKTLIYGVGEL